MIKSYKDFIIEKVSTNRFGCVMLDLRINNWESIIRQINKDDLYSKPNFGIETDPHITVFYGLHSNVPDEKVISIINKYKYKQFNFKVKGVDSFKNTDYDVLKFSVEADDVLQEFNNELSKLPNSNEYPDYKPHITIAYLLPGMAEQYYNLDFEVSDLEIKSIKYSKANGQKLIYNVY